MDRRGGIPRRQMGHKFRVTQDPASDPIRVCVLVRHERRTHPREGKHIEAHTAQRQCRRCASRDHAIKTEGCVRLTQISYLDYLELIRARLRLTEVRAVSAEHDCLRNGARPRPSRDARQ